MRIGLVFALAALAPPTVAAAHDVSSEQLLPVIGPAPEFALTSQDGLPVAWADFRGRVVAVTFIYTACPDVCSLLTDKMAHVRDELGAAFGPEVAFVSITVDPEHDTPEVLKEYAATFDADPGGWVFLTGAPADLREAARGFGVAVATPTDGRVDHTLLTTLVDRDGAMRVQYLGYRFDPDEFRRDLLGLLGEP